MKLIALYARVSTSDRGQDPEMQLRELREQAARRSDGPLVEYRDECTGTRESRPALDQLMADVRAGKVGMVMVWKFDRFARSVRHLLKSLDEFTRLGVAFVSLTEGVDTTTPVGRFTLTILGAVGELERSMLVERTRAGLALARARGKRPGRQRNPFDFSEAKRMLGQGVSKRRISRELNVPLSTLRARFEMNAA